jgi:Possible lysine decarboxylase
MVIAKDLTERKVLLLAASDPIVVMVGGLATLDEATEILELRKHGLHRKPVVLLNTAGFYDGLILQLQRMEEDGLLPIPLAQLMHQRRCLGTRSSGRVRRRPLTGEIPKWPSHRTWQWTMVADRPLCSVDDMMTATAHATHVMRTHDRRLLQRRPRLDWSAPASELCRDISPSQVAARRGMKDSLLKLIEIRPSAINKFALRPDMRSKHACATRDSAERLTRLNTLVQARRLYTAKEIAALELTDATSIMSNVFDPCDIFAGRPKVFGGGEEQAQPIAAIAAVDKCYRLRAATRLVHSNCTPSR